MTSITSAKPVFAEISEDGRYIEIYFRPSPRWLEAMHKIEAKFMNKEKVEQPHWRIARDFFTAKRLAEVIGQDHLQLGEVLEEWGHEVRDLERTIQEILNAEDWELDVLPKALPELYKWFRPYQRVAVAYMSEVEHCLNASQPGLGKTPEAIGAVYEAQTHEGPNLVVAPKTSLESVWEYELNRWQKIPVFRASGDGLSRWRRYERLLEAEIAHDLGKPFWLVVNPEMVRYEKINPKLDAVKDNLRFPPEFEWIHEVDWNNVILDEVHKNGLRNTTTITAKGMLDLKIKADGKKIGLSGTPVGGKPINLFGILHWLAPDRFPSKYKWAQEWLSSEEQVVRKKTKSGDIERGTILLAGDVKEERREEFDRHLMPIMIRHTKAQVLKDLPAKDIHELWCSMTEKQAEQYEKFAKMAEVELGDDTLTATNILAIYTRLKQFAGAKQRFEDGKLIPVADSGKLNLLMEKLDELGILDGSSDAQAIVASQFVGMTQMVYDELMKHKVPAMMLTGKTKKRADVQRSFQKGEAKVIVIQSFTGGVSITLDQADTVFILDEWWDPDTQEQVEDRAHRASRMHQVTVFYLRTRKTIEESIRQLTGLKGRVNKRILDERKIRIRFTSEDDEGNDEEE